MPSSPTLARAFRALESASPAAGGWLAERLWFRLPPTPESSVRDRRTPRGGELFEVDSPAGTVRGRVYGAWGNPTAYLVHGWAGWWQQLGAYVQPLVDAGLCVVAMDAPSHGSSEPGRLGPRSTTLVEMAEGLAAVVGEFGRAAVIVAHSAGCMAVVHARSSGVVADAYVFIAPPDSVDPMMRRFGEVLGVGHRSLEAMLGRAERRVGLPLSDFDLVEVSRALPSRPPLLLVHDRQDPETPVSGSVALHGAWAGSELVLTEGLGHRRVIWEPAVVERVTEFAVEAADRVRRSSR